MPTFENQTEWFKSSQSFANGNCVEVADLSGGEVGVNRPVFDLFERFDLTFALNDQAQGNGLNAASGKPAAHFIPQ